MRIGIKSISTYLPSQKVDSDFISSEYGFDLDFVENKIGIRNLYHANSESTLDMAFNAAEKLINENNIDKNLIDIIVVCTQTSEATIPQISTILQSKLHLSNNTATYDISQGCAAYPYALNSIIGFMENLNYSNGILITVDKYSSIIKNDDRTTKPLFSDGSTATLISTDYNYNLLKSCFYSDGSNSNAITNNKEINDGFFFMDGRKVYNFVMAKIPSLIEHTLKINNLKITEINRIVLHQGSKFILDNIIVKLGLNPNQFLLNIQKVGNLGSSSIPFLLSENLDSGFKYFLLVGFGIGLSGSSTIISRRIN